MMKENKLSKTQMDITRLVEELNEEIDKLIFDETIVPKSDEYFQLLSDLFHIRNSIESCLINVEKMKDKQQEKFYK